jgi:hypothetical protein
MGQQWNDKPKDLEKNLSQCHFVCTTNPAWIALGVNTDLRDEKPAANRLSYGTTLLCILPPPTLGLVGFSYTT